MRAGFILLTCFACACAAAAQTLPPVQDSPPLDPKKNQKIERIHVEDNAVAIDEVRYAGQTESVTVQPKDGLPAYEIQPPTQSRQGTSDARRGTAAGDRVWSVFSF